MYHQEQGEFLKTNCIERRIITRIRALKEENNWGKGSCVLKTNIQIQRKDLVKYNFNLLIHDNPKYQITILETQNDHEISKNQQCHKTI